MHDIPYTLNGKRVEVPVKKVSGFRLMGMPNGNSVFDGCWRLCSLLSAWGKCATLNPRD